MGVCAVFLYCRLVKTVNVNKLMGSSHSCSQQPGTTLDQLSRSSQGLRCSERRCVGFDVRRQFIASNSVCVLHFYGVVLRPRPSFATRVLSPDDFSDTYLVPACHQP